MRLTLTPCEGEDTGMVGFAMPDMPDTFEPVYEGLGVVHDLMEHFEHDGTLHSEFMAFGCMLWGRWEGGYWHNLQTRYVQRGSWGDQVGNDFAEMYRNWINGKAGDLVRLVDHKRWSRFLEANRDSLDEDTIDSLESIGAEVRKHAESELDEDELERFGGMLDIICSEIVNWSAVGYLRARARGQAHGISPEMFAWTFKQAQEEIDKLITIATRDSDTFLWEGSGLRLKVAYQAHNNTVTGSMIFAPVDGVEAESLGSFSVN